MSEGIVRIGVELTGRTPLLMNRMLMSTLDGLRLKEKKAKTAPRPEDPREEAAPKVHQTDKGLPVVMCEALLGALIGAGVFCRLDGKRQVSTGKSTTLPGFLTLEEPYFKLKDPATGKTAKWEVDMRQGKNPNGGEAVCIVRPRFDCWRMDVTIQADTDIVPKKLIRDLFDIAGKRIGLYEFTPRHKGPYGCFDVTRWEQISQSVAAE